MNETEKLYLVHRKQGEQLLLSQTDLSELERILLILSKWSQLHE